MIVSTKQLATILRLPHSELTDLADNTEAYYRVKSVPKNDKLGNPKVKDGKLQERTITYTTGILKQVQTDLFKFLSQFRPHEVAFGGIPGRSTKHNALEHMGKKYHFVTDIRDFYPSITFGRVFQLMKSLGFNRALATVISKLITYKGVVPQGVSTSSHIANLVFLETDNRLYDFCKSRSITYTRFVDDLAFSAKYNFVDSIDEIVKIIQSSRFKIHAGKTQCKYGKIEITGVVTYENRLEVPYYIYQKLEKNLLNPKKVEGYINYIQYITGHHPSLPTP